MTARNALPVASPIAESLLAANESLSGLWASIVRPIEPGKNTRVIVIAADPGEGATTVAVCIAMGLSEHLQGRVALVETNVQRPGLATYLGVPATPGYAEVAAGEIALEKALRHPLGPELSILPAGALPTPHPGKGNALAARAGSELGEQMFRKLAEDHRYIVIDAPPILHCPEASCLFPHADQVVLVADARNTDKKRTERAARLIQQLGGALSGVILNRGYEGGDD